MAVGLAIAGLGPLLVAAVLVPFRTNLNETNAALCFVVLVVLAAACGGRWVGCVAAVVCTLSYDFFFTKPYQSLHIERTDDIITTVLLLAIGLIVGETVVWAYSGRRASDQSRNEIARLHRVAEQVAVGESTDDVQLSVQAELIGLLSLLDCHFERPPFSTSLPRLQRNGSVAVTLHRFVGGAFALPADGVEIQVLGAGHELGRIVLDPNPDVGVSIEKRVVAVALVDQLGAALAADHGNRTRNGTSA